VKCHGLGGYMQHVGDLFAGFTVFDEVGNLKFGWG
jgi:hypothetical protein